MAHFSTNNGDEEFDRTTSAAICNAIGERLRRDMDAEDGALPSRLQMLMDELHRRDRDT